MTIEIGRPPPAPGREGGAKTSASTPATLRYPALDLLLEHLLRALALGPVLEGPERDAAIGLAAETDDREAGPELRNVLRQVHHLVGIEPGVFRGRVARRGHERKERTGILFRGKLARSLQEHETGHRNQRYDDHQRHWPIFQRTGHQPFVTHGDTVECAVDQALEPSVLAAFQDAGRHHRRYRHCNQSRNHHRAGKRQRKLAKQRSGEATGEGERREHGGERDRHGDDRREYLAHAAERRLHRRQALLDMALDVLDHDDGVVDHQADRQNHGEQRQEVDRIAHREKDETHADQRQRYRHDRHQHRPERAQEQEDDDDDDRNGFADRLEHLLDRGADRLGRIVDERDRHAFRQGRPGPPAVRRSRRRRYRADWPTASGRCR